MNDKFKIHRPFSPAIGQYQIPNQLINEINEYVELVNKNNKLKDELDHGKSLAGEVSQEIRITKEFLNKGLLKFLGHSVENYIKLSTGKNIKTFKLIAA